MTIISFIIRIFVKIRKFVRGFTLIEMMVVVSIILFLSLISIPIYQGSKKELALQRATNKLAQDIRRAQEMAMSAKKFGETVPKGGYGVHFNMASTTSYILFADTSDPPNYLYDSGEVVENIFFEGEVKISQLSPLRADSTLHIVFTPPDPTTRVNTGTSIATITLQIDNSTSSVKVLSSGLIYIE